MQALIVEKSSNNIEANYQILPIPAIKYGEVLVEIHYSSLNHKDLLAFQPNSGVIRQYPMIPGIDFSGIVINSLDPNFERGDQVLATGYELGVTHYGGFATHITLPGDWLIKLPTGLTQASSMQLGTAGLTAALSVKKLLENGMQPSDPILVTGVTGGVGAIVVSILNKLNFENITLLTHQNELSSQEFVNYNKLKIEDIASNKLLAKQQFSFAIDCVGGDVTGAILKVIKYGGALTVCGNIAGNSFEASLLPFILRSVSLFGIDSVAISKKERNQLWRLLGTEWLFTPTFETSEIKFKDLKTFIATTNNKLVGRNIIKIASDK